MFICVVKVTGFNGENMIAGNNRNFLKYINAQIEKKVIRDNMNACEMRCLTEDSMCELFNVKSHQKCEYFKAQCIELKTSVFKSLNIDTQ